MKETWLNLRIWFVRIIAPEAVEFENDLRNRFSCLLDYATGGKLSKTNYTKQAMYGAVDEYIQGRVDDAVREAKEEEG